jgi:hypothetical protein
MLSVQWKQRHVKLFALRLVCSGQGRVPVRLVGQSGPTGREATAALGCLCQPHHTRNRRTRDGATRGMATQGGDCSAAFSMP